MPTDRRPQPWRETRSPALARLPFLMGAEGEPGQAGWQAAPPGPRLLTDTKSRCSPRFNRKPAGAASGPQGIAARLAPPRTRLPSCAPLPCAPPSLGAPASPRAPGSRSAPHSARARRRLADSREPPGGEEGGVGEEGGRPPQLRSPGGVRRVEEQPWETAGGPGRKGCLGPVERAESPARHCPSFPLLTSLSAHCSRSWGGVRMRALCPRGFGLAAHPQTRGRSRPHRRSSHRPSAVRACRVSAALSPHPRRLSGR